MRPLHSHTRQLSPAMQFGLRLIQKLLGCQFALGFLGVTMRITLLRQQLFPQLRESFLSSFR